MNHMHVPHTVAMPHCAGQRYAHNLHIGMGMRVETLARCDHVVIQHPQLAKIHAQGIVVIRKTKRVVCL